MPTRPKTFEFDVSVDQRGDARSSLGGSPLPAETQWWAEHLVLAGLVRCTLASMSYYARRAGLDATGVGRAHGIVTRREDDGLYALVDIETTLDVTVAPAPEPDALGELVMRAQRGCFVSNSLTATPRHRWTVNGEEVT